MLHVIHISSASYGQDLIVTSEKYMITTESLSWMSDTHICLFLHKRNIIIQLYPEITVHGLIYKVGI